MVEENWIPHIREKLADGKGPVYVPARECNDFAGGPCFSLDMPGKDGKRVRVFVVGTKPWATFLREGEESDSKGLCMWMPDAFFETHGRDGLPLDV